MRCLYLNIRGFGVPGRRTLLKEYLRKHKIDVVCLQETIKDDFTDQELHGIEVGEKFFWSWLPANGHSGGLLMGVRDSLFEVGTIDRGPFFLSLAVLHRPSKRLLELVGIYGPADHSRTTGFLDEISHKIENCQLPMVMGGDFNLIRGSDDKNNDNLHWPRINLFNSHIANWDMIEIPRSGARYTWSNKRLNQVRCVLDRVFMSASLDTVIPLCSLIAETSLGSAHTPLILDTGEGAQIKSNRFFFESTLR